MKIEVNAYSNGDWDAEAKYEYKDRQWHTGATGKTKFLAIANALSLVAQHIRESESTNRLRWIEPHQAKNLSGNRDDWKGKWAVVDQGSYKVYCPDHSAAEIEKPETDVLKDQSLMAYGWCEAEGCGRKITEAEAAERDAPLDENL